MQIVAGLCSVKKTCRWHVFSVSRSGYAARAPFERDVPYDLQTLRAMQIVAGLCSVKKTCRWHVFSVSRSGYAARATFERDATHDLQALRAMQIVAGLSTRYRNNYQLLLLICAKHKPELVFSSVPKPKNNTAKRRCYFLELVAGLEPATCSLRVSCSTN